MSIIFKGGSQDITVPQGQKIGISCVNGTGVVYYSTSPNSPSLFYEHTRVTQSSTTLGTFDTDRIVRISALNDNVTYDVAVTPTLGLQDLTDAEISQLSNIGATTISAAQWGYVGGANQAVKTTDKPSFAGITATNRVDRSYQDYTATANNETINPNGYNVIRLNGNGAARSGFKLSDGEYTGQEIELLGVTWAVAFDTSEFNCVPIAADPSYSNTSGQVSHSKYIWDGSNWNEVSRTTRP